MPKIGWDFPASFPFTAGFKILCQHGAIEWGFEAGKNIKKRGKKSGFILYGPDGKTVPDDIDSTDSFVLEDRYFVECIKQNKNLR